MEEQERPFVMVGGKKYVLAEEETSDFPETEWTGPEPEIFQKLGNPPRNVSFSVRLLLLLSSGSAPLFGWFFACFGMIFCIVFMSAAAETVLRGNDVMNMNDNTPFGAAVTAILISIATALFPIIGMSIVLYGTFQGKKAIRLLQEGEVGRGHYLDMKPTGTQVNGQNVMKLHYKFRAADGEVYDAYATALDTSRLIDDPVEPLLYDPLVPDESVLLDSLPGKVRYDEMERTFKANPLRIVFPLFFCLLFSAELLLLFYSVFVGGLIPFD